MKNFIRIAALSCTLSVAGYAQNQNTAPQQQETEKFAPMFHIKSSNFRKTKPLREITPIPPEKIEKDYEGPNKLRRYKHVNPNALPLGNDPVWQMDKASHYNKAPLQNWDGTNFSAYPPDPSGAVSDSHYVHMVNTSFTIYDKIGNSLYGPAQLGTLLGGNNDGDPIVLWDKDAERWFMSQFKTSNNALIIAISETSDPLGSFYLYEFALNSFPDYPKYGIWHNSYFVTANKSAPQFYAMERDKMLLGDPTAGIQGFTIPNLTTNGFFSVIPSSASSTMPSGTTAGYLYYFQDDGWGVASDHIKIWDVEIDWANSANSSISTPEVLNVSPFDSEFQTSWDDIEQPGTSDRLDGIPTAFMYMAHYREFPGYAAVVLNHTVDVSGTDHAGIRWYELRKTGSNPWTVHQEGTFAPDGESRWLGSIAMDYQGNIGLAYSVSGPTVYPSIRYTGRYASDPAGQMTLAEEDIVVGAGIQTGPNRWGDYAHMTIDPTDDATFWYTGEYIASGNARRSRIASFKIANDEPDDLGVVAVTNPVDGVLSGAETITVTVNNFGLNDQSNFPVAYSINGGTPVVETYTGTLTSGNSNTFNFTTTGDFSSPGVYDVKAWTGLVADTWNINDTTTVEIKHLYPNDIGVTAITSPTPGGTTTATESVTITIQNFGSASQSGFDVAYSINGGTPIVETYTGSIAALASATYTFSATADLSALGDYDFVAYTALSGDSDLNNDTSSLTVSHELCMPQANCSFGDGFTLFKLNTINNPTACSNSGYGDYTQLSTTLERGEDTDLTIRSGYTNQTATCWIDFNDNFVFETTEIVVLNGSFGTTLTTLPLSVPSTANLGEHLLRIRSNWNNQGTATIEDPCVDVNYGETEDYTVEIIEGTSGIDNANFSYSLSTIENGKYAITLNGVNGTVNTTIHNSIGQMVKSSSTNMNENGLLNIDLSEMAKGPYLIKLSNNGASRVVRVIVK